MALTPSQLEKLRELHTAKTAQPKASSQATTQAPLQAQSAPAGEQGGTGFIGGLLRGVGAPGRTFQSLLPRSLSTLPNFATGKMGTKANEMPEPELTTGGEVGNFIGEASTFLTPGGLGKGIVPLAAQGVRSFGMQSLNEGEVNRSSFAAGATDALLIPGAQQLIKVGGTVLKGLAGGLSGKGADVIEAALDRPGAAFKAAGTDSLEGIKELSGVIRGGTSRLTKQAGDEYADAVAKAGVKEIPRDFVVKGITQRLADLADGEIVDGTLKIVDSPLTDVEERQLTKAYNVITKWTDFTPAGLNTLARRISKFRRGAVDSANFDRIIDTTRRELRDFVGKVEPKIADVNAKYGAKMDLLDEVENILKTDNDLGTREGIRKTAEALGRLFNGNKALSRDAVEELEQALGVDILGTLAGQQLSDVAPRSTSAIGGVVDTAVQSVSSPVLRNAVPLVGAIQQQVVDRVMAIPGVPESARAVIINAISEIVSEFENTSN